NRSRDPRNLGEHELPGNPLPVRVTLRESDSRARRRDRGNAVRLENPRARAIPDVDEDDRVARSMKRAESVSLPAQRGRIAHGVVGSRRIFSISDVSRSSVMRYGRYAVTVPLRSTKTNVGVAETP